MIYQYDIPLFLIVSAIAVFETIYWVIISINRIMDFIFKTKTMSKEITYEDILDAIYGQIDESADEYARNKSGYILDGDELGAENNPQKHNYDRIKRHYKAGASPCGERLAAAEDLIEKIAKALIYISNGGATPIRKANMALTDYNTYKQGALDLETINEPSKYAIKRQETERQARLFIKEKQKAWQCEKALSQLKLHIISCHNHLINPDGLNMLRTIDEALTPKQTTDDTDR